MKNNIVNIQEKRMQFITRFLLVLVVFLTNLANFIWYYAFYQYIEFPASQVIILFITTIFIFWIIHYEKIGRLYLELWKKNWIVVAFVVLALTSIFWTANKSFTIFQGLLAIFSTLIAAYFGAKFSNRNLVNFIAIVIGVFAFLSLLLVILFPTVGIHTEYVYAGLWHGVFWHKIYLGATMALGFPAYLIIIFSPKNSYKLLHRVIALVTAITGLFLSINADAASGLVLYAIQACIFVVIFSWLKWKNLLTKKIYLSLAGVSGAIFILLITNLDSFLGLFKRSSSLTGRVPMWEILIKNYISIRPLLGYGFGAFWEQEGMKKEIQSLAKWFYPILVADNGYLDITLGLGIIGVGLLISILVISIFRSLKNAIQNPDLTGFFPVFILVHIIIVNISLSYFFENEVFIWFLLILVTFMATPRSRSLSKELGN